MKVIKFLLFFIFLISQCNLNAQVKTDNSGNVKLNNNLTKIFKQADTAWNGVLTSSNLPIIVINTNNVNIPDTPKIAAQMGIIYNGEGIRNYITDPFNNYNNKIGIELRGSTSLSFPQKQYSIETRDVNGLEHDTVVLGMPSENSWILYAPYNDKTCLRNVMSYEIARRTGQYSTRTKYCELVLNGQYQGIYVWMEKIKRDSSRVNISKLKVTDTIGDQLTGGYIIKIDKPNGSGGTDGWNSLYQSSINKTIHFLYEYPENVDIVTQQKTYIKAYVDSFEIALKATNYNDPVNGYRKFIDVNSFIDYIIFNEISKNVDGYRLSTFLFKDRYSHGGKLYIGPVWDYNIAWWNANYCNGNTTSGWAYNFNSVCSDTYTVPFWWAKFLQDTTFKNNLKCRYTELRQSLLSISSINSYIDSIAGQLNEAQARHFVKWPILGVYTWPNPTPYATSYAGEITALKNWIQNRINWIDANISGNLNYPVVNLGNDTSACPSQLVLNAGNPGSSYLWNNGSLSQTITVNTAGSYAVTVNKNGCKKSDTISISMKPVPNAFAGNDTSICQGKSIALNATGGVSYIWNNNVLQGVSFVPVFPQNYTVSVTGANGCTSKDSVYVNLITLPPKPLISVIYSQTDTLISSAVNGNQWFKNGLKLNGETHQKLAVSPNITASYSVVVTENGCNSDSSDIFNIFMGISGNDSDNFSYTVYPNPFTNQFKISYTLKVPETVQIRIMDITGREIKAVSFPKHNKGEYLMNFDLSFCESGIYFYIIKAGDNKFSGKMLKTE